MLFRSVVLKSDKACVIDADGLYALKELLPLLKERQAPTVLTPHPGEMAHLVDKPIQEVMAESLRLCEAFTKAYPVTLVFKTERSLVVTATKTWFNSTGNTGLAKGGSGDVLCGMITGFLAQGVSGEIASVLGVYGHGKAADYMAALKSPYALCPTDLYEGIEKLFIY